MADKLLEVKNLHTSFFTHLGEIKAVQGASLSLEKGRVLGIVGESGSGKSVTALSIMGLVDNPGKIKSGQILFNGRELAALSDKEMNSIRGKDMSMIFQDPMTSLNPVYTIENQMVEVIRRHNRDMDKKQAVRRAVELLELVGIPEPNKRVKNYPHEFSGGMRQRVMIANAMSCNPKLLIADEPTTALDVTIQAQILSLIQDLKEKMDTSVIIITHDLGVIAEVCDSIVVMYGGNIMEWGSVDEIFYRPGNPYTVGLHQSVPKMTDDELKQRLIPIEGTPPDLLHPLPGCPFAARCPHSMEICLKKPPPVFQLSETQASACWLFDKQAPSVQPFSKIKEGAT